MTAYYNFSIAQKELMQTFIIQIINSDCTNAECLEVISEIIGYLMSFNAPLKDEMLKYLDDTLVPQIRRSYINWYDIKHFKEEFGNI